MTLQDTHFMLQIKYVQSYIISHWNYNMLYLIKRVRRLLTLHSILLEFLGQLLQRAPSLQKSLQR